MTVKTIAEQLGFIFLCGESLAERPVSGCYCGDLLSWVMSRAQKGDVWLTVMGNINSIGVAALVELACIVLTENAAFDLPALEKAKQNDIIVLRAEKNTYQTAAAISKLL